MTSAKDELAFEKATDERMEQLAIAQLPARAIISQLHAIIFYFLHILGSKDREAWKTGDTMTYRLSYIIPWLRRRNGEVLGASAEDVLQAYREADHDGSEGRELLAYAHFCELMPEVHRGRLEVEKTEAGFRLVHPSAGFALAEATDIIMSELALNHIASTGHRLPDEEIFQLARTAPVLDEALLKELIKRRAEAYRQTIREAPLVGDRAMQELFGFDRARFAEIQSVILGMADVFSMLGLVLWVWSDRGSGEVSPEALEWVSICWTYEKFLDKVAELTTVARGDIASFIEQFTLDYTLPAKQVRGGEGFMPPFARMGDAISFSPDLVFRYSQPRNALAHVAKTQRELYDELISHELEPTLIDALAAEFASCPDIVVCRNVAVPGGEIDLLVADGAGKHVLLFEVKAPLPPQGSRPTARLADRIREGLDQLKALQDLPDQKLTEVLGKSLGIDVSGATFSYLIAARSCFGAIEVWQGQAGIVPVTLPLMRLAMKRIRDRRGKPAMELPQEVVRVTQTIVHEASPRWVHAEVPLNHRQLETPQLLYDEKVVQKWIEQAAT